MAKVLNLDSLAKKSRAVVIRGQQYEVKEMTVEDFIEITKQAKTLEKETDPVVQMNATVEMLRRAMPSCPTEVLKKLRFEELGALTKFIQGELDGDDAPEGDGKKG